MEYNLQVQSKPIVLVPFQERWAGEFRAAAQALRAAVGDTVLRIDHIGSTSVPGLSSKDIIDLQITVANLDACDLFRAALLAAGYRQRHDILHDHVPLGVDPDPAQWRKRYFREADGRRILHLHVREAGRLNQRYALLFRDYLRAHPPAWKVYEQLKLRLAEQFPACIDAYLYFKDPICDLILQAADHWARSSDWTLAASDV